MFHLSVHPLVEQMLIVNIKPVATQLVFVTAEQSEIHTKLAEPKKELVVPLLVVHTLLVKILAVFVNRVIKEISKRDALM